MVKISLKDVYLGGTTPTTLKNEVSTCPKIHYDKDKPVMVNQSLNDLCNRFPFKFYALPQDVVFPLDIAETFFNNLIPDVREFFMSEGFQVNPRSPT